MHEEEVANPAHTESHTQLPPTALSFTSTQSFERYQKRKAPSTVRRQKADLTLFETYLTEVDLPHSGLLMHPAVWQGISYEYVETFLDWQLEKGYAIETINARLSTVKRYAGLACKAGFVSGDELARIKEVQGFRHVEGRRIDQHRPRKRIAGSKKAEPTFLSPAQLDALFSTPDSTKPQGLRDLVMLRLLYDLGPRPGELTTLVLGDLNLAEGKLLLRRHKTADEQVLLLPEETLVALHRYLQIRRDQSLQAPLLVQTTRYGKLVELVGQADGSFITPFWSIRNLSRRVHDLGKPLGIDLCAQDARHQWTRTVVDDGNTQHDVLSAGGWTQSSKMIRRYYAKKTPANEGILRNRRQQIASRE